MNKYFDKNDMFDSNNRIYEGYFTESKKENYVWSGIMSLLLLVIQFLSKESFLQKAKMVLVALSLIGFIGIVGAMEAGSLQAVVCRILLMPRIRSPEHTFPV